MRYAGDIQVLVEIAVSCQPLLRERLDYIQQIYNDDLSPRTPSGRHLQVDHAGVSAEDINYFNFVNPSRYYFQRAVCMRRTAVDHLLVLNQSIKQTINQSINQINQSVNQSIVC